MRQLYGNSGVNSFYAFLSGFEAGDTPVFVLFMIL